MKLRRYVVLARRVATTCGKDGHVTGGPGDDLHARQNRDIKRLRALELRQGTRLVDSPRLTPPKALDNSEVDEMHLLLRIGIDTEGTC